MKQIKLVFLAMLLLAVSCKAPEKEEKTEKPANIVLILADDLGYGDLSCYGQEVLSTPNLDQMAAEGIIFTNHYTGSTVCAPSRASLLTGKHPGHASVRVNLPPQLLNDEDITIAEKMKEAGYVTGAIGKWGVGHPPPPDDPKRNGFDYFYGYINMWHAHNFYPEFLYKNGEKIQLPGNELYTVDGKNPWADAPEGTGVAEVKVTYVHDLFDNEALEFIENNKDTTFFLYMAYNVPHANNEAGRFLNDGMEVENYGQFEGKEWPDPEKGFAKMIENLDNSVGMISDKLKELGLEDNTLVIFVSDNGPHQEGNHNADFFDSNGILRGKKRDLYEGGIRTPFIAKWPGKIEENTRSDHISAFWDMLPTFCEVAGVEAPTATDGISFLPVLLGNEDQQEEHAHLYFEFYEQGGKQAVRKGKWKAVRLNVRSGNPDPVELYDLSVDPSEENNIADQHPEMVEEILKIMEEEHEPLPFISLFEENVTADTRI